MSDRPTVEFFYYGACPWTWMATGRLVEASLRTRARIAWRPILLEWLPGVSHSPPPAHPARAAYARKDLMDWAAFLGLPMRHADTGPGSEPCPEWAQRGAVLAIEDGVIHDYAEAAFRARFADGRSLAELPVVLEIAAAAGVSGDIGARIAAGATADTVRANGEELVRRGGFGSPTFFVGDDMYFGNDRMPLVESALMRAADRPFIAPGEHWR